MQTVARKLVSATTYIALAIVSGIAIALLAQQINPLLLFLLVVAVPIGLYVFSAVPLIVLKVKKLFNHLRWWHVLWFLFFLSGLTFRVRGTENIQENPLDLAAFFRVALVGLVGFVLFGFFFLKRHFRLGILFRGGLGALTAYALFSVLSTLWSVYPAWTFYKSIEYLVGVVLIGAIVASVRSIEDFKRLFDWMWFLIGILLLSVWASVVIWPHMAINTYDSIISIQIQGVMPIISSNGVGTIGAILGIISFVRFIFKKYRIYMFIFILSIITLILAQTRSAWLAFMISILIISYLKYGYKIVVAAIWILPILALVFSFDSGKLVLEYFKRGQDIYSLITFTGRIKLWEVILAFVEERPILGYGAMAGTRFMISSLRVYGEDAIHSGADNTFLEVLLGTGVLGLSFLIISILWVYNILLNHVHIQQCNLKFMLILESIGVLTILLVRAWFTAGSFIWHPALTWFLILGFAEFLRRRY